MTRQCGSFRASRPHASNLDGHSRWHPSTLPYLSKATTSNLPSTPSRLPILAFSHHRRSCPSMESYDIPRNRRRSTGICPPSSGAVYKSVSFASPSLRLSLNPLAAALYDSAPSRVAVRLCCRPSWLHKTCWENLMVTSTSVGECYFLQIHSSRTTADLLPHTAAADTAVPHNSRRASMLARPTSLATSRM